MQLVDVPCGRIDCREFFWAVVREAPAYIQARFHSRGTHIGRDTNWAGGYETYEIYDERRPDWPTAEVEEWRDEIENRISAFLQQQRIR